MFYRPNAISSSYNEDDSLVVTNVTDTIMTPHGGDSKCPYGTMMTNHHHHCPNDESSNFGSRQADRGSFANSTISCQSQLDRRYSQNMSRNRTARQHRQAHNTTDGQEEVQTYRIQNSKSLVSRPVAGAGSGPNFGNCANCAFKADQRSLARQVVVLEPQIIN